MDTRMFGRRLRAARISAGFEHAISFAKTLEVAEAEYLAIETGAKEPTLTFVEDVSRITGKSLDFLITGREHQTPG